MRLPWGPSSCDGQCGYRGVPAPVTVRAVTVGSQLLSGPERVRGRISALQACLSSCYCLLSSCVYYSMFVAVCLSKANGNEITLWRCGSRALARSEWAGAPRMAGGHRSRALTAPGTSCTLGDRGTWGEGGPRTRPSDGNASATGITGSHGLSLSSGSSREGHSGILPLRGPEPPARELSAGTAALADGYCGTGGPGR